MKRVIRNGSREELSVIKEEKSCWKINCIENIQGALSGSKTNTVVAANDDPSSLLPGLPPFTEEADNVSPGQTSSAHTPTHWATSHWMCTSEPLVWNWFFFQLILIFCRQQ